MEKLVNILSLLLLLSCNQTTKQIDRHENPLAALEAGNNRFRTNKSLHPHVTHERLIEVSKNQNPFAVIISCSDSRVCPEIIFDQGLGDLFVIRTAGNILGTIETGSVEYAVEHLNVKLIVVIGHEECGAIKAVAENTKEVGNLAVLVDQIKAEPEIKNINRNAHHLIDTMVQANVRHVVNQISCEKGILSERVKANELQIIGAEYFLTGGAVKFLTN